MSPEQSRPILWSVALAATWLASGCSDTARGTDDTGGGDDAGMDGSPDADADSDSDSDSDTDTDWDTSDPTTCAEAEADHTYVGCDFWPTVLPNVVGTWFDYTVVVSNTGDATAHVTIERDGAAVDGGDVAPGGLTKFFLPWVSELKHWTAKCDTGAPQPGALASKRVPGGAYHLTSDVPVTVFQFNPLEYAPKGGPDGKDWSNCKCFPDNNTCHSYSNDASLLLPSTAMTGNYRITAPAGQNTDEVKQPGYFAVTGLVDGTTVKAQVGQLGEITPGGGIPAATAGQIISFAIDRGEVVLIVGTTTTDLSGTVLNADQPIQVMSGAPCMYMPDGYGACDHLEETVVPAETFGARYFAVVPTNPRGKAIGHVVKIFGNVDGTTLTYPSGTPNGAPGVINAGDVVDLGIVKKSFEVVGDQPFAVSSFQLGGGIGDPGHLLDGKGDPAQSNVQPVEQYRARYVFLAPDDYDFSFVDAVVPDGTVLTLDGVEVTEAAAAIGSGYGVVRIAIEPGAHLLESDQAFGLQVMGYGFATSYQYPGGLNLKRIADPPVVE